jgi:hypothetical protein
MNKYPTGMTELEHAIARAEYAEQQLRALDRAAAEKAAKERAEAVASREAAERAAREAARANEIEATRRAGWLVHYTSPERVMELAENQFSPEWLQRKIPTDDSWAPGDSPALHIFTSDVPLASDGNDDDVPPLVLKAREAGLPI